MTRPLDLDAVRTRLHHALTDLPVLIDELERLRYLLVLARSRYADLLASARATIGADHDGEADPLFYLRDELEAHDRLPYWRDGGR